MIYFLKIMRVNKISLYDINFGSRKPKTELVDFLNIITSVQKER